jgi:hypothetical protein
VRLLEATINDAFAKPLGVYRDREPQPNDKVAVG